MSLARLVVTAVVVEGRSKSAVARDYRVSRRWVITLVQRFLAEGETALAPRSRRPHTSPRRTPRAVEDEIVALRKELDRDGHEAGAATIAYHLEQRHGAAPAVSTIWRILKDRGFVTPQPHKRPRSSWQRFQAEMPNERWQTDITHWRLANGREVEILNILDDHSRVCVASRALAVFKADDVTRTFTDAVAQYGSPASMLSDNGAVFTGGPRGGGRVSLELALLARGITFAHSRPYHPQTCGKVERFHQTVKKWLANQPRARSVAALQAQLDRFRDYYNTVRPHRALGRRTPMTAFTARPKAVPTGKPIDPGHYRVRHDKIDDSGVVTLRHDSRLHHIGLGRRHAGTRVLVLAHDLHIRVLTEHGQLLRDLLLDPSRDYQPQPKP
ncbi:MAG TPA: IS481 family transposase [Gemmatimonadales bacterium]|jgi:transposase InsO family protein|nr:IS481 family transposase [Gemmatimonadales bacterium]